MSDVIQRIKRLCSSEHVAGLLFGAACLATLSIAVLPQGSNAVPTSPSSRPVNPGSVGVSGKFSQGKIVQGSDGTIFMEILVDPPTEEKAVSARKPVDMIVVLDHSGSMSDQNRLPLAKSAINSLLSRLTRGDRFGLVTFESEARIVSQLASVTDEYRTQQQRIVSQIAPAGSTNLSGGLQLAQSMLSSESAGHIRKIVLLSDGEANVGITDSTELGKIARAFGQKEAILSTIGMGLNFNETLMAALADNGMGNYTYLENLAGLDKVLNKDLQDSRSVYASASNLEVRLPAGFQIVDSSGYPQEVTSSGTVRLLTGQLLSGVKKSLFITLKAPTDKIASVGLESITFNYVVEGAPRSQSLDSNSFALNIVPPSEEAEALKSVDKDIFKKGWATNAIGSMQRDFSQAMKEGDAEGARARIESYRRDALASEKKNKIQVLDSAVAGKLEAMSDEVSNYEAAPAAAKPDMQKRIAKQAQLGGVAAQRAN